MASDPAAPVSVVVGAGPAGILTALFLARRGHQVHVFDRRPSPLAADSSDDTRAFMVVLHERGDRALRAAGIALQPGAGLQRLRAIGVGAAGRLPLPRPKLLGSRHAFVAAMVAAAQAQALPNLTWHWCTAFRAANLQARTATFEAATATDCGSTSSGSDGDGNSGTTFTLRYDLLVGADGGWSRVRRAAEAQCAELTAAVQPSEGRYQVARGLPPCPLAPTAAPADAPADSDADAASTAVQLRVMRSRAAGAAVLFLAPAPSGDGTTDALLALPSGEALERMGTAQELAAFLRAQFPALPPEWLPLISERLAASPASPSGTMVRCSQLHAGASLVLVGDAGHGVTPRTGNGLNASCEDALVLDQLLEARGGDLAGLPAAFTAARLADAHALGWLDATSPARGGSSPWGRLHPAALGAAASMVARGLLSRAAPGWVAPPSQVAMNEGLLSYSQVKGQVRRDGWLLAASLGLTAAAAAGAGLLRAAASRAA